MLKNAWKEFPHPIIIEKALKMNSDTDIFKQIKTIQEITNSNPNNIETHIALGATKLKANIWGEAKYHLFKAIEKHPSPRAYQLLSLLEKNKDKNDKESNYWLEKAENSVPDPTWVCKNCYNNQDKWMVNCNNCNSFDSLEWKPNLRNNSINKSDIIETIL